MYAPTFFDSFIFNILIKRHDFSCFSQISVLFLNFCLEITNKILQKLFLFVLRKDVKSFCRDISLIDSRH